MSNFSVPLAATVFAVGVIIHGITVNGVAHADSTAPYVPTSDESTALVSTAPPAAWKLFDFHASRAFLANRHATDYRWISFGSSLSAARGHFTWFYHDVDEDSGSDDSPAVRAGLGQTWSVGPGGAQISLGYEYVTAEQDPLIEDRQGHSLNLSSRFPLFWGLRASLAADYSRVEYPEYEGGLDLRSDRAQLSAAISRSFGAQLYGGMHVSYADEDFEESPLSYRRRAWGLNLRYDY